jgi:hypothetical protein
MMGILRKVMKNMDLIKTEMIEIELRMMIMRRLEVMRVKLVTLRD